MCLYGVGQYKCGALSVSPFQIIAWALHFMVSGVADIVLYHGDPRAHGVRWAHHVLAQMLALWFLGNPGNYRMWCDPPILTVRNTHGAELYH